MFKKLKESIAGKIKEIKELKAIEQAAYEEEKAVADEQRMEERREAAREKGKAKAHKSSMGIFEKLDKAAERMEEYNAKQKSEPIEFVKIGSLADDEESIELVKFGTSDKDTKTSKLYKV